jgi:hypothetical protein
VEYDDDDDDNEDGNNYHDTLKEENGYSVRDDAEDEDED